MHHVEQVIVTVSTLGTPMAPMLSHVLMPKERISFTVLCTDLQQLGKNVAQLDMRNIEKPYGHNVSERLLKGSRTTWVQICQRSFLSAGSLWCRATDQRSCCGCAMPMYQIQVNSLQLGRNPCFACCSGQDKGLYSNVDAWSLHHGSDPKHRCSCCRSSFAICIYLYNFKQFLWQKSWLSCTRLHLLPTPEVQRTNTATNSWRSLPGQKKTVKLESCDANPDTWCTKKVDETLPAHWIAIGNMAWLALASQGMPCRCFETLSILSSLMPWASSWMCGNHQLQAMALQVLIRHQNWLANACS